MSDYQPTPEVLKTILNKADEKLAAAKVDMEAGFFGEAASCRDSTAFGHELPSGLSLRVEDRPSGDRRSPHSKTAFRYKHYLTIRLL